MNSAVAEQLGKDHCCCSANGHCQVVLYFYLHVGTVGHASEIRQAWRDVLYSSNAARSGPHFTTVCGKLDALAAVGFHATLLAISQGSRSRKHLVVAWVVVMRMGSPACSVMTAFNPGRCREHWCLHVYLTTEEWHSVDGTNALWPRPQQRERPEYSIPLQRPFMSKHFCRHS